MKKYVPEVTTPYILKLVLVFFAYFITAKIGLSLYPVSNFATFIWPTSGIAMAVLILYGYDLWPGIFLGALAINLFTGAPLLVALGIAVGNSLEAIIATYFLRRYVTIYRCFERLQDTLSFILFAGLLATMVSATIGVSSLFLGHLVTIYDFARTWLAWWIGDSLGALVVAPFLITWFSPTRPWNNDHLKYSEIFFIILFLFGMSLVAFSNSSISVSKIPLFSLISLPLLWAGIRLGTRGMTGSIFVTSFLAILLTFWDKSRVGQVVPYQELLFLQIFIGSMAITFLVVISLIKERKQAVYQLKDNISHLEDAVKQITYADRAKNDFLAILAHELRNPLAPILSSLELLKIEVNKNSKIWGLVKDIGTNVNVISHILNDLLDISKISREQFSLDNEIFNLQMIIRRSIETVAPQLKKYGHQISISLEEKPVWIYGDPVRIEQMIINLLTNAIKYTEPPNGKITVVSKSNDYSAYVHIKDNGIGIPEDNLTKIFEPFIRLDKEHKEGGLGIGLSFAKKLAVLHGGDITARSEGLGKGSEFIVNLPITENTELLTPLSKREFANEKENLENIPQTTPARRYSILLVDDNETAAKSLGKLLEYKGHKIKVAYNGPEAIEIAKKATPEIVILDIGLPIMDGYEVARRLRKNTFLQPTLIALTGYGQEDDKIKAIKAGFDFHMTKPVSIDDIEKILLNIP